MNYYFSYVKTIPKVLIIFKLSPDIIGSVGSGKGCVVTPVMDKKMVNKRRHIHY
jgi:hypothetical protein